MSSIRLRQRRNLLRAARAIDSMRTGARHRPVEAFVEIVSDCNIRCTMCALSFDPAYRNGPRDYRGKITREVFDRALPLLAHATKVHLMGTGEPTMHPDLAFMVEALVKRGAYVTFNTNGVLLDPPLRQALLAARLPHMALSLDGARAATYESIRHGARLDQVLANVRALVMERDARALPGPCVTVSMVLMRDNVGEIAELAELATTLSAPTLHVEPLLWQSDPTYEAFYQAHAVPEDEAREAVASAVGRAATAGVTLVSSLRERRTVALGDGALPGPRCTEPWTTVFITREGKLRPCCNSVENLGAIDAAGGPLGPGAWDSPDFGRYRADLGAGRFPDACAVCAKGQRYRRVLSVDAQILGMPLAAIPATAR